MLLWFWYCKWRILADNSFATSYKHYKINSVNKVFKYSIIPYSSIISGYSCILTDLAKTVSAHMSAVLSCRHKLHVCVIFLQFEKEGTCFCAAFYSCARQIMA